MASNPNGANGNVSDPREETCWRFYIESLIGNKGNAYESAIKAGYAIDTARNITTNDWFKERLGNLKRKDMFSKAERNLDKVLDLDETEEGKINPQLLKIKTDVSTTIVKTLGKDEGYSDRTEHTGKNGDKLFPEPLLGGNSNKNVPDNQSDNETPGA